MQVDLKRTDATPWLLIAIYIVAIGIAAGVSSENAHATYYVPISLLPAIIGIIILIRHHIANDSGEQSSDK